MREEIQTYSSPCGILSVYGVFFGKEFSTFIDLLLDEQNVSLGAPLLFLNENSQNWKNKLLVVNALPEIFPSNFPAPNMTLRQQCSSDGQQFSR